MTDLSPTNELTVEQMCRNLLTQAINSGLVITPPAGYYEVVGSQTWTSCDLAGMVNLLTEYLSQEHPGYAKQSYDQAECAEFDGSEWGKP